MRDYESIQEEKDQTEHKFGLIIQMGQFNPLHRMHEAIARDAIEHYPGYKHRFGMALETCDKGTNTNDELCRRKSPILFKGFQCWFFKNGRFVDVIQQIRATHRNVHIVFAAGEDTIYRFFRDWDAFRFTEDAPDDYRLREYKKQFDNVDWYVTRRECLELDKYKELTNKYIAWHGNFEWSPLELDSISSTKIRNGQVNE